VKRTAIVLVIATIGIFTSYATADGPSVKSLEDQITKLVTDNPTTPASDDNMLKLNDLKVSLMGAIDSSITQLTADKAKVSGESQDALQSVIAARQAERKSLSLSLGKWISGLQSPVPSGAGAGGTMSSGGAAGTVAVPTVARPPCSLDAAPVDTTSTPGSSKYTYTINCSSGVTPSLLGLQATSSSSTSSAFAGTQAFVFSPGIAFDKTDAANSAIRFTVPAGSTPHTFQIVVPTASTTSASANFYVASDSSITDVFACKAATPPSGCSSGTVQVPIPSGGSLADNVPAGLDITKGNTMFTQSTVGLNISSASGSNGVQANFSLNFFLTAPLWGNASGDAKVDCTDPIKAASPKGVSYCHNVIPAGCAGNLTADCIRQIQVNQQQKDLRRQFRDPLGAKLWAYLNPTLSTIPQTGLTISDLVAPSSIATTAINRNANTDVTKLVQAFNFEQGLEWKLWLKAPYMTDAFGRIPREGSSANRVGLFLYGGYGIGVPVNGTLNPTTVYDLNGDLYANYNLPSNLPGTPPPAVYDPGCGLAAKKPWNNPNCGTGGSNPYKYLALQQVSSLQFFQSYYLGLRLKTFTYSIQPCKHQPDGAGSGSIPLHFCSVPKNLFPGMYDIGIGQDQAITGYKFHGPVLRAQANYSLPFYTPVHLFGSIRLALSRSQPDNVATYVLTPDTAVAATSPATYLQPVPPPTRSLYSFGIGIDLIEAIKKGLQSKTQIAPITPTTTSYIYGYQKTVQLYAPVTGTSDTTETWQLTGPESGPSDKESIGSISSDSGLYTFPTTEPKTSLTVTIRATAKADGSKSSTIQITIKPKTS